MCAYLFNNRESSGRDNPRLHGGSNTLTLGGRFWDLEFSLWSNRVFWHAEEERGWGNCSFGYTTINLGIYEESLRIQAWLSPLSSRRRRHEHNRYWVDGNGDWFLQRNEFQTWSKSEDSSRDPILLCYGNQGVGKTYISHLVVQALGKQSLPPNVVILCHYCNYQAQKEQSAVNIIGDLLAQVGEKVPAIESEIRRAFNEWKKRSDRSLQLPDMAQMFVDAISSIRRAYICIDAVDALPSENRSELLRTLQRIIQEAPNARLFLTTRPHIRPELDQHLTKEAYVIDIVADQEDIARYVTQEIRFLKYRDPGLVTENLEDDIRKVVSEEASRTFLLAKLNIDAILGENSITKRQEMLQKVATTSPDLESVYARTLQRIREQEGDRSRFGIEVLMWVSHSERPLKLVELWHALTAVPQLIGLRPRDVLGENEVLETCLGLVVVDSETSELRPIHYTLQEYLSKSGVLPHAHKTLAESCLAYLYWYQVKVLRADRFSCLLENCFLEYSSLYWGNHAKIELSDYAEWLAVKHLAVYPNHISATLLFNQVKSQASPPVISHLFSGLHCASCFGIVEVVASLIGSEDCDINQQDCNGFTPLMWAAWRGNEAVVRILLTRDDVDPDRPDNEGRTPLWCASSNGNESVVGLLIARDDVNPDKPDNRDRTPLWCASENGNESVVKLLLTRNGVDPDKPDNSGKTPLWCASENGHEAVVALLLKLSNVDPDKPDNNGQTSLWPALLNGHVLVVNILLTRADANPDKPDNYGRTLLWWASGSGKKEVVTQLLQHGANPDQPDVVGRTPLLIASMNGHREIVALLQLRMTKVSNLD